MDSPLGPGESVSVSQSISEYGVGSINEAEPNCCSLSSENRGVAPNQPQRKKEVRLLEVASCLFLLPLAGAARKQRPEQRCLSLAVPGWT